MPRDTSHILLRYTGALQETQVRHGLATSLNDTREPLFLESRSSSSSHIRIFTGAAGAQTHENLNLSKSIVSITPLATTSLPSALSPPPPHRPTPHFHGASRPIAQSGEITLRAKIAETNCWWCELFARARRY
jgi:hypothetical protein